MGALRVARPTAWRSGNETLVIETRVATEFTDITERLVACAQRLGLWSGLLSVQSLHTTTGILVNEAEPLLLGDLEALLRRFAPPERAYAHDDLERRTANLQPAERRNGHAHCQAALLPVSATLHVSEGRLVLGRWQRVLFAELDGPQRRRVHVVTTGEMVEGGSAWRQR